MGSPPFLDRRDAGSALAKPLARHAGDPSALVLGLGRGGLRVAAETARELRLPVEIFLYWHLRGPWRGRSPIGVATEAGTLQIHRQLAGLALPRHFLERAARRARAKVDRLRAELRDGRPLPPVAGKTVLLIGDGAAPGPTLAAAVRDLRAAGAARVALGLPVVTVPAAIRIRPEVDELVALRAADDPAGVSWCYVFFDRVSTKTAKRLLLEAVRPQPEPRQPAGAP